MSKYKYADGSLNDWGSDIAREFRRNWMNKNCQQWRFRGTRTKSQILLKKLANRAIGIRIAQALKTDRWDDIPLTLRLIDQLDLRRCARCNRYTRNPGNCDCQGKIGKCAQCGQVRPVSMEYDRTDSPIGTTCRNCRQAKYKIGSDWYYWPDPTKKFSHSTHVSGPIGEISRGEITCGFELEAAFPGQIESQVCEFVHRGKDRAILHCKHDGSILDNFDRMEQPRGKLPIKTGLEFCSGFGSFEAIKSVMIQAIATIKNFGGFCPKSCGLHVAIGGPFSEIQKARAIAFWNDPDNRLLLYRFSRRLPNRYCRAKKFASMDTSILSHSQEHYDLCCDHGKYIEFRAFSGSITANLNFARIAFCKELLIWCGQDLPFSQLTSANFESWIATRKSMEAKLVAKRLSRTLPDSERDLVLNSNWVNWVNC